MQLLAAKFAQIATAIDTTNAQIAALQAKLSEL
jgi:outer membrane murein-binding lipoprotein Lpp